MRGSLYARFWKRGLDLVFAVVLLFAVSPLMFVVAVTVLLCLGRPILFRQVRTGRHGQPFTIVKFRTMRDVAQTGEHIRDESILINRVGVALREWGLDELPELWNIVRGQMSFVGPRPLLHAYQGRYSEFQKERLLARPGLTGLAQVSGRNSLSWNRRFRLDVWYVRHLDFALDARIVAETARRLLLRHGTQHAEHQISPEFIGRTERDGAHQSVIKNPEN